MEWKIVGFSGIEYVTVRGANVIIWHAPLVGSASVVTMPYASHWEAEEAVHGIIANRAEEGLTVTRVA